MKQSTVVSAVVGVVALGTGLAVMMVLLSLRKPPAEASTDKGEKPIHVQVLAAQPEDVPVSITGYGQARALRVVRIAPEVSGKAVEIHPNLVVGGIIPTGEALFRIDPRPYESKVREARAQVAQRQSSIARLRLEREHEAKRLDALEHALALSQAHYDRARQLRDEGVGTDKEMDEAEQGLIAARNQKDTSSQALQIYPVQIDEMEKQLASAQARLDTALLDLESTEVTADFTARVKEVSIETGQFATAGMSVLTLADDSVLEFAVPLDSRNAYRWLRFNGNEPAPGTAWFKDLEPVACDIQWTEAPDGQRCLGAVHRVEAFDPATRTLTVAVRYERGQQDAGDSASFPLVDGMFCEVEIPGRVLEGVYRLPQGTVSFENTVFVAQEKRLKTVAVEVAHAKDGYSYVSAGLNPGDLVITTRLVNPLDSTLLEFVAQPGEEGS